MAAKRGVSSVLDAPSVNKDDIIGEYQRRPIAEIHRELAAHGIDPNPTIKDVLKLVEQSKHGRDPKRR